MNCLDIGQLGILGEKKYTLNNTSSRDQEVPEKSCQYQKLVEVQKIREAQSCVELWEDEHDYLHH